MEYFLGIDIGTTAVKSIAFSRDGKICCEEKMSYPILHPAPAWSEQDPDEICRALCITMENVLRTLSPDIPVLCSFSSAMHSLIAVDRNGKALTPSIIWADNRAAGFAETIRSENRAQEFYQRTGLPVHAMSPFCKIKWIRENQKEIFASAFKFVGIKEFFFFRLFGTWIVDASIAAATGFMNMQTRQWDPWILKECGLDASRLSEIVETEACFTSPRLFPALKEVPFIIGGSDGAMANIGTSDEPDALVITIGTSSAARLISIKPKLDPDMRTFCYYLNDQQWLVGGASNNGGIVLQWLQEDFYHSNETAEIFLDHAFRVKPGSDGLIFLPYLLGERAPVWNANARGVLFGLDINHGQAQMIRASLEGVIYCLYAISRPLLEQVAIRKIYASGGFARTEGWVQMLADTFNLPVLIGETVENSAWGAVKWGMTALGIPVPSQVSVKRSFYPDASAHSAYAEGFDKFQRLYNLLKGEYT